MQRRQLDSTSHLLIGQLRTEQADQLYDILIAHAGWCRRSGRRGVEPRDTMCFGIGFTSASGYRTPEAAHAWPNAVAELRDSLNLLVGRTFNAALANRYVDGKDSVAWHDDLEPHIVGPEPVIASVSLGATRSFLMRSKHRRSGDRAQRLELSHGTVVVMAGATQEAWEHSVPKTRRPVGPRINLTFREYQ